MSRLEIAVALLLISFQAGSNGPGPATDWSRMDDVKFQTVPQIHPSGYDVMVVLQYDGELRIDFIVSNELLPGGKDICKMVNPDALPARWDINGRNISYTSECGETTLRIWPTYRNEVKYVIDEFLTKSRVHVGDITFGTDGFMEGYSEVLRYSKYVE